MSIYDFKVKAQDLYDFHQKDGLELLDYPCNQFADQAPGSDEEIHSFCTGRYGLTFPQNCCTI